MSNSDIASVIPLAIVAVLALIALLFYLTRALVNVSAVQIAIKERRYF
jgi:uncharacterized membrane protein